MTFVYVEPGVGVIKTDTGDIPVSAEDVQRLKLIEGDTLVGVTGIESDTLKEGVLTRSTAQIVGVIKLEDKKLHGHTKKGLPIYTFVPLSWHYPEFLVPSSADRKQGNILAVIQFHSWENSPHPIGTCIRVLGPASDLKVYNQGLLLKNGLADNIKKHQLSQVHLQGQVQNECAVADPSVDFTDVIVIDPEGSTDCDDGFSITDNELHVHIADVDYYFPQNGPYESEIRRRVTSIYSEDKVYHMLPEEYASGIISLNRQGLKRTLTVTFNITDIKPVFKSVRQTVIKVKHSLTYEKAQQLINDFIELQKLASLTCSNDTHKMIETIMIWTNEAIGKYIYDHGMNFSVYCPVPPPSNDTVPELKRFGPRAVYSATEHGHGMMGKEFYTHFTSPIRRYADIVVHRLVKDIQSKTTNDTRQIDAQLINNITSRSKRYYRDLDILTLVRKINGAGTAVLTGYIIDFTEPSNVSVYIKEHDIVIHAKLFHPVLSTIIKSFLEGSDIVIMKDQIRRAIVPMYKEIQVCLACLPSEIRLNRKLTVSFPIISSVVLS